MQQENKDYHYTPKAIDNTCCKVCGIYAFEHIHRAGTLPKDFERVENKEERIYACSHYLTPEGGCGCNCHKSVRIKDEEACFKCMPYKEERKCIREGCPINYGNVFIHADSCPMSQKSEDKSKYWGVINEGKDEKGEYKYLRNSLTPDSWVEEVAKFRKEFWKLSGESAPELDRKQDQYIRNLLELARSAGKEAIKRDLLEIADKGEYEDLRREVEGYFKD